MLGLGGDENRMQQVHNENVFAFDPIHGSIVFFHPIDLVGIGKSKGKLPCRQLLGSKIIAANHDQLLVSKLFEKLPSLFSSPSRAARHRTFVGLGVNRDLFAFPLRGKEIFPTLRNSVFGHHPGIVRQRETVGIGIGPVALWILRTR